MGSSDSKYFKREHRRSADGFDLSLRKAAWLWARTPSGSKMQRVALAWLRRKSPAEAQACEAASHESDASLARKAATL